jgi:uncharacterized protein with HEPN domain
LDERIRSALEDMLDRARELQSLRGKRDAAHFLEGRLERLATERLLETIGEAAIGVPEFVRRRVDLPWPRIVGLRNILIHAYDKTDPGTLAAILTSEVPTLIHRLDAFLGSLDQE